MNWVATDPKTWYLHSRRHQASKSQYSQALILMICLVCESLLVSGLTSIDLTGFPSDLSKPRLFASIYRQNVAIGLEP